MQLRKVGFFTQLHKLRSLRRSFLHFHFISAVHILSISYIINTSTVCAINDERKLRSCCMKPTERALAIRETKRFIEGLAYET